MINTSPVTSITENVIDPSPVPVPVLASDDSVSTNSHLNQTWIIKFLLKHLLDSTIFANHTNSCQTHPTSTTFQVTQYAYDSYHPYIDELFAPNSIMTIHYQVIRHSQLVLNQNQADIRILSMKCRKEVFLGTYNYYPQPIYPYSNPETNIIQYQDAFNIILITIWSDGLFKALFWKSLVQRIIYHCFSKYNLNNQVVLSNNSILLTSAILAHSDSISNNFLDELLFLQAYLTYSKTTTNNTVIALIHYQALHYVVHLHQV